MKTQDIQRGIASRRMRAGGDAPDIGRISRLRQTDFFEGQIRTRRHGDRANAARRKTLLVWSAMLSIGTLAVIGGVVFLWLIPRTSTHGVATGGSSKLVEDRVRVVSKFPSPSEKAALDLAKRALSNRDPDQVASLFRMGNSSPAEILDFLRKSAKADGSIEHYEWLSSMDSDGILLEGVLVGYPSKVKPVQRIAFLTPDARGDWKVDFDAFARTVTPPWGQVLDKQTAEAQVRVFVGHDFYFNGPFSDDKEWTCYTIASPDQEESLHGYCKVGSPQAAVMEKMLSDNRKLSRATLNIKRVKDGESHQFEISRVVAEDWVVADRGDGKS
jgi:hypothetical protein